MAIEPRHPASKPTKALRVPLAPEDNVDAILLLETQCGSRKTLDAVEHVTHSDPGTEGTCDTGLRGPIGTEGTDANLAWKLISAQQEFQSE